MAVGWALIAAALSGCEENNTYVEPPPPKVTVAKPEVRDVTEYLEFTGTTVATARVELRARVPGVLQEMHFQPGTVVQEGDLLFTIDPLEYEAAVAVAKADLARAEALKVEADKSLERAQTLIQRGNISKARLDEAIAEAQATEAGVLAAKATLRRADIDLGYTHVTAPIMGRVGRNRVDVGNLVGDREPTVLTDITTYHPMYVYFSINERDLLRILEVYRVKVREKGMDPTRQHGQEADITLEMGLANEQGYPHKGLFDFSESSVDPGTGTIEMRGVFPNEERPPRLVPGLFARTRMPIATLRDMPLVSERAIAADQQGPFLLVVTGEDIVEKRSVVLGPSVDGLRVIADGIGADDRVIVRGIQRARPGGRVDPETVQMGSLTTAALFTGNADRTAP